MQIGDTYTTSKSPITVAVGMGEPWFLLLLDTPEGERYITVS